MNPRKTRKVLEINYGHQNGSSETFDPLKLFLELGPFFVQQARLMQKKEAVSHRNVLVGACALVNNVEARTLRAYVGFNFSPYKGIQKHCAEMRSFGRGISDGYSQREAIVIAGPTDPDIIESITGASTATLYPCAPCTNLLEDPTVVATVSGEKDFYEIHTGAQLHGFHRAFANPRKKSRRRNEVYEQSPTIHDENFVKWTGARALYDEKTNNLEVASIEELRMARAEAFVEVLRQAA